MCCYSLCKASQKYITHDKKTESLTNYILALLSLVILTMQLQMRMVFLLLTGTAVILNEAILNYPWPAGVLNM